MALVKPTFLSIPSTKQSTTHNWEEAVKMKMIEMDRRRMLESVAALIGVAALPLDAMAAVAKAPAKGKPALDAPTMALVSAVADTIVPRTDTPGALQVGVPARFAGLLQNWANAEHKAQFLAALAAIDTAAKTEAGKPFTLLPASQREIFLRAYDKQHHKVDAGYTKLKDLLVMLYYYSEAGATVELRYEHVPGAWEASIPLTPQTRAWAGANVG
jgi:hypothetical protein